jgi:stalled ribosome rescue protein Dom34
MLTHTIVWIDHHEAKIFLVDDKGKDKIVIQTHKTGHHLNHKANVPGSGHQGIDREFFKRVVAALDHSGSILLTGPANAKAELKNFVDEHYPDLARRIAGVATLDHPSEGQLVALARKFFKLTDEIGV